jgi:chitodextrinase
MSRPVKPHGRGLCAGAEGSRRRRLRRLAALTVSLSALFLALEAGSATAIVAHIGGRGYGVTLRRGANPAGLPGTVPGSRLRGSVTPFDEPPFGGGPLEYHGGPVMHSNATHVIYWDPEEEFTATTKAVVNGFFTDVAHDSGLPGNVFGVDGQYTDHTGHAAYAATFAGPLTDSDKYPPSECTVPTEVDKGPPYTHCLTDAQLRSELSAFIKEEALPRGSSQLYFLLLPHKVVTCFESTGEVCSNNEFCAYHSLISGTSATAVIYADIPFSLLDTEEFKGFVHAKGCQADKNEQIQTPNGDTEGTNSSTRFADVAVKYISHEYSEAITDPALSAWFDEEGNENGDKCNSVPYTKSEEGLPGFDKHAFIPTLGGSAAEGTLFNQSINGGHFYVQSEWDNPSLTCLMKPLELKSVGFSHSAALVGAPVAFSGGAADPYGEAAVTWSFGDGATASGPAPTHTYSSVGSRTVTMTATDPLTGSTATSEQTVTVNDLPTAAFKVSGNGAPVGTAVILDGTASSDPDGSIASYSWSFGDGATATGGIASHAYATAGQYTATLTVIDSAGLSSSSSQQVTVTTTPTSAFASKAAFNTKTGTIILTLSVSDPGTLSWLGTFQNGKFGAFASAAKCRKGQIRLGRRCRPAKIVFAKGHRAVTAAGTIAIVLKPTASGLKALKNALKRKRGVPVSLALTFQSSRGGRPVTHTRLVVVKLKKR